VAKQKAAAAGSSDEDHDRLNAKRHGSLVFLFLALAKCS